MFQSNTMSCPRHAGPGLRCRGRAGAARHRAKAEHGHEHRLHGGGVQDCALQSVKFVRGHLLQCPCWLLRARFKRQSTHYKFQEDSAPSVMPCHHPYASNFENMRRTRAITDFFSAVSAPEFSGHVALPPKIWVTPFFHVLGNKLVARDAAQPPTQGWPDSWQSNWSARTFRTKGSVRFGDARFPRAGDPPPPSPSRAPLPVQKEYQNMASLLQTSPG